MTETGSGFSENLRPDLVKSNNSKSCLHLAEVLQDAYFLLRLAVKSFLIADHLQCHCNAVLVVIDVNNLTKAALAQHPEHLIAVGNVVVRHLQTTNKGQRSNAVGGTSTEGSFFKFTSIITSDFLSAFCPQLKLKSVSF